MNKETALKVIVNETLDEIADRIVELYGIIAVYNEWERLQCDYRDPVFCIDPVDSKPKIDN